LGNRENISKDIRRFQSIISRLGKWRFQSSEYEKEQILEVIENTAEMNRSPAPLAGDAIDDESTLDEIEGMEISKAVLGEDFVLQRSLDLKLRSFPKVEGDDGDVGRISREKIHYSYQTRNLDQKT
jgi:hypothetical protein